MLSRPTALLAVLLFSVGSAPALPAFSSVVSPPALPANAAEPVHDVRVTGEGVGVYPAFDPGVSRYAVTTSEQTGGTVVVAATTSDPAGVVRVGGRRVTGGTRTVTGLEAGDEVAVFIDDAAGRSVYSFVYLPDQFPTLERTTPRDVAPTLSHVMLTLGLFVRPSPYFETALDANGVPAVLRTNTTERSMDFKAQPNGHYSVARGTGDPAYPNSEIVELDRQFREVGRYRTVGLQHTDAHDSILLPDGSRYLMAYEPDAAADLVDAVIQHVSPAGEVLFSWNSRALLEESVTPDNPDYAHVNSFQVMRDGDLLVSFRHLSSVLKIAREAHDGFAAGDVVWRLGGRASDFSFSTADGSPGEGPCAQHTATELPDGNILVFDNGSASMFPPLLCVDPADPDGPLVQRVPSRVAEWAIDEDAGTATLVRDHRVGNRFSIFAGSAQPLANGGSVVGWAPNVEAITSELDVDGSVRWELRDTAPEGADRYYTYRAHALDLPDATSPAVSVDVPASGATYVEGDRVDLGLACSDRGGSSLQTCDATTIDTRSPGVRTLTVTARDGAGNVTTAVRRYRVVARHRPDASIRAAGTTRTVGEGRYGAAPRQQVRIARSRGSFLASVRVRNAGARVDRVRLVPTLQSRRFTLQPVGARTSPLLRPGQVWTTTVRVRPTSSVRPGDRAVARLDARSLRTSRRVDTVWLEVRRS